MEKLIQLFSKNLVSESMKVVYEREFKGPEENRNIEIPMQRNKQMEVVRIWFSGPGNNAPQWGYLRYDKRISISRMFHFEIYWLVCDAWHMEDFVNQLYRRCLNFSLRIVQIPEFFCTSNLCVHPYRAQPYIPFVPNESFRMVGSLYPSPISLFENLFIKLNVNSWIKDDPQVTDWKPLGISSSSSEGKSNLTESLKNADASLPKPPGGGLSSLESKKKNLPDIKISTYKRNPQSKTETATNLLHNAYYGRIFSQPPPTSKNPPDRQYMHRNGFAALRIGSEGIVWLLNTSARVNDINISADEKKLCVSRSLEKLTNKLAAFSVSYDIMIDIIEEIIKAKTSSNY